MDLQQIKVELKQTLNEKRYLHSIGVEEVACDMAIIFGYDAEAAAIAGILHDCAKHLTDQELLQECTKYQIPVRDIENKCPFLLHAKVGAFYAKKKFGVEDDNILNAITYHTTGRPSMGMLEKIIFIADYIEPYRRPLPRINQIREAAYTDLDSSLLMVLDNVLSYLETNEQEIDSMTIDTYQYYKKSQLL